MLVLYSTNTALKYRIQRDFLKGFHYCWCSPVFDASKLSGYSRGAEMPPSSDPSTIYRDLKAAVDKSDDHCDKIASQKATLSGLAVSLEKGGKITSDDRDEILAMVGKASFKDWRPFLYVIPAAPVLARLKTVPRDKRASNEMEYIVEDLQETEFHIIEFPK